MSGLRRSYDVVVVGGGSTGSTLAGRLSERKDRTVLVLEAGPAPRQIADFPQDILDPSLFTASVAGHPANWSFPGETRPGVQVLAPRGRFIGGSGSINGAYFIRGRRSDFDRWEKLGNDLWSYDQVLPFYRRLETDLDFAGPLHGSTGPVPVVRHERDRAPEFVEAFTSACVGLGHPLERDKNGDEPEGVGPVPLNIAGGRKISSAIAYLLPHLDRPNLHVCGEALVRRVLFADGRAQGVEVDLGGQLERICAGEVILAAGALRTPQLLLLSGIGPQAHLAEHGIHLVHHAPGVGAELVDHPDVILNFSTEVGLHRIPGQSPMTSVLHWMTANPGEGSDGSVEILTYANTIAEAIGLGGSPNHGERTDDPMHNPFVFMRLMQQHSRGRVSLRSADPYDGPGLAWNFLEDDRDVAQYREVVRTAARIFESDPMREIGAKPIGLELGDLDTDAHLDEWIRAHLSKFGPGHATSTCRMGPESDELAVVDQAGLVRGVSGLRIADTSIFPTELSRGTSASAVMAGERLSDLIS
ncbi:TPA: mycofactocin system GMC family oxidoreductase MftG [Burkholderia cenocepacia]|nr:mycofactocin system GMC family oxidoreductase MftG [Burkholderia cenocepacia]